MRYLPRHRAPDPGEPMSAVLHAIRITDRHGDQLVVQQTANAGFEVSVCLEGEGPGPWVELNTVDARAVADFLLREDAARAQQTQEVATAAFKAEAVEMSAQGPAEQRLGVVGVADDAVQSDDVGTERERVARWLRGAPP